MFSLKILRDTRLTTMALCSLFLCLNNNNNDVLTSYACQRVIIMFVIAIKYTITICLCRTERES